MAPLLTLPVVPGLGAYPGPTTPPAVGSHPATFGLTYTAALTAEIDFAIAAIRAASQGRPIPPSPLPEPSDDPKLQAHLALLLQIQRTARAWLYAWPPSEIVASIPGATPGGLAVAKAALWNPLWGPPSAARTDRRAQLAADLQWLRDRRTEIAAMIREVGSYAPWLQAVLGTFQRYVEWFTHHLEKKQAKAGDIAHAIDVVSIVVNFIPVVGQIVSLALTAVSVGIQVHALRESLKGIAAAGGRIVAGQVAAAVMEGVAVTRAELQNLDEMLAFATDLRTWELTQIDGAAGDPGTAIDVLPPRSRPVPLGLMALGVAGLALALAGGGRRGE